MQENTALCLCSTSSTLVQVPSIERRSNPRIEIDADVLYRTNYMEDFESGRLLNLSQQGALLSVRRMLSEGTEMELIISSEDYQETILIFATIARNTYGETDRIFFYGCTIW